MKIHIYGNSVHADTKSTIKCTLSKSTPDIYIEEGIYNLPRVNAGSISSLENSLSCSSLPTKNCDLKDSWRKTVTTTKYINDYEWQTSTESPILANKTQLKFRMTKRRAPKPPVRFHYFYYWCV